MSDDLTPFGRATLLAGAASVCVGILAMGALIVAGSALHRALCGR